MRTTLISCQELSQQLNNTELLILDCRFNLADTAYGLRAYQQAHIPQAQYLDLDQDLSSPISPDSGRHPLPDSEQLSEKLRSLGLNPTTQVVAYDDCGGAMAARAWWLLRWLGHQAVAVLDGGFPEWQRQQHAVTEQVLLPSPGIFIAQLQQDAVINTQQLLEQAQWLIVDARTPERFRGEQEPIDPVAGTIPGAINRPLGDNLVNGMFKPATQLHTEWQNIVEQVPVEKIVHMCGSGVTACHNQLALEIAGITGSRLYAGSWSEWIRDPQRPITKGSH